MKVLLALALPFLAQQAERPAWDVADRWACETTRLRICKGLGGACTLAANRAHFRIDFAAGTFGVGTAERPLTPPKRSFSRSAKARRPVSLSPGERIAAREYLPARRYPSGSMPGVSKLALDSGDSFTLATLPGRDGKSHDALLTRAQLDSQYLFYGACRPV